MALLLNHLRRVAAHCDKNKMTIDNLAICFGPVLLCPAPSSTPDLAMDFKKHIEVLRYLLEIWDYEGSTSKLFNSQSMSHSPCLVLHLSALLCLYHDWLWLYRPENRTEHSGIFLSTGADFFLHI